MNQYLRTSHGGEERFDWWVLPPERHRENYQTFPDAHNRLSKVTDFWNNFSRLNDHECVDQWRVVAIDLQTQRVAGAVRLLISHQRNRRLVAEDIVEFGAVEFADQHARQMHLDALNHLIDSTSLAPVGYVGEFFVAEGFRRTRLCLSLGLSVHAMGAIHGWKEGVTFATTRANADKLFLRMGGHELWVDGKPLPNFFCTKHQQHGRLMGLKIYQLERPDFKDVIDSIQQNLLSKMLVKNPEVNDECLVTNDPNKRVP